MPAIHRFDSLSEYLRQTATGLSHSELACPYCGRTHRMPIDQVLIGQDMLAQLPQLAQAALGHAPVRPTIIYDRQIQELVEVEVIAGLLDLGMPLQRLPLGAKGHLLEASVEVGDKAGADLPPHTDFIVGVGSGVISDLTKWIATARDLPFLLYGTAPSMNAHTSITAAMSEHGVKSTRYLTPAQAVVFDLPLLATAPLAMLQAGLGDLAARFSCNADWQLSHQLRQTYFCPLPYQITQPIEAAFAGMAAGLPQRDPHAIHQLSEAVLMSGISMTILDGETSPSSGCEHIFSHYWDLLVELEDAPKNLHGTQVAVGTLLALSLYEYVLAQDPDHFDPGQLVWQRKSLAEIEDENVRRFGAQAELFNQSVRKKWLPDELFAPYLQGLVDHWEQIWSAVRPYLGRASEIRNALESAGMQLTLEAIQRTRQQGLEALLYGSRYRPRYTILDLAWELGIFPQAAEEVLARSGI